MKLAPFNYYPHPASSPLLCELDESGFVYFPDACTIKHRTVYQGHFVPLVEAPTQLPVGIPATVAQTGGQA